MARFVSVSILAYHSGTEERKFIVGRRMEGEHAVQLLCKTFFSACQTDQSVYVMLYRPEILPTVTFADMRCISICFKVFLKFSLVITRLHERGCRIVYVTIVLRPLIEFVRNLFLSQFFCHAGNAVIIISVFKCFG